MLILCLSCSCFWCLFGFKFSWGCRYAWRLQQTFNSQFLCHRQIQSIYPGRSVFTQQVMCNKLFPITITVLHFAMHVQLFSKIKHLYIEIRVLPLLGQCMWSVAYCSSKNHSSRLNILRIQIAAFHFTGISKLIIKWTRQSSTFNGDLVNERLAK